MLPNFLVVGAEKAGTTWLYDVMRGHPALFLPDTKEVHFFNRRDSNLIETDNFERRGLDWYERHFAAAAPDQIRGEATPMYICDEDAPDRIRKTLTDPRFILLLRDPVTRAISHYRMAMAKSHIAHPLEALIDAGDARILERGLYASQLERWFSLFSRESTKVLIFEEVMAAPETAMTEIADWFGIDPAPFMEARLDERRNEASGYHSAWAYNASVRGARALRNFPATRGIAKRLKAIGVYDFIKSANRTAPPETKITATDRRRLCDYYRNDIKRVAALLGRDGLPWQCAAPSVTAVGQDVGELI
ncbi:MAG: hypothetical protein CMH12_18450 [Maritimibacter sp.]|nr:hypothetical protein [Maritimibacter sp.]